MNIILSENKLKEILVDFFVSNNVKINALTLDYEKPRLKKLCREKGVEFTEEYFNKIKGEIMQEQHTPETYGYTLEEHNFAEREINNIFLANEFQELYAKANECWFENLKNEYEPIEYTKEDFKNWLINDQNLEGEELTDSLELFEANCENANDCGAYIMEEFVNHLEEQTQEYPREIFQWFMVDSQMARLLEEIGQPILETESSYLWGRTCYGQSIILDGTFQRVHKHITERS